MKVTNVYFSATGRAKAVADRVVASFGEASEADLSRMDFKGEDYRFTSGDLRIFTVSVYEGRVPKPAARRIKTMKGNKAGAVLVAAYGARAIDDRLLELSDLVTEAGFVPVAGIEAVAQHSIITRIAGDRPNRQDREQVTGFAEKILEEIKAEMEKEGENFSFEKFMAGKTLSLPGKRPYVEMGGLPLHPKGSGKCVSCKKCVEACPVGAISPENPRFTDKDRCITCMRCVQLCPVGARDFNPLLVKAAGIAMKKRFSGEKLNRLYLAQ